MSAEVRIRALEAAIAEQETRLQTLREELRATLESQKHGSPPILDREHQDARSQHISVQSANLIEDAYDDAEAKVELNSGSSTWPLSHDEYRRYGRQLIMPEIGLQGQLRLRYASVLIVGAGGLGCPAAAYLAGAGIGHIGIIDGDTVEESNLHRQILHSASKVGMSKVDSAIENMKA